jgi:hypothetical protein
MAVELVLLRLKSYLYQFPTRNRILQEPDLQPSQSKYLILKLLESNQDTSKGVYRK